MELVTRDSESQMSEKSESLSKYLKSNHVIRLDLLASAKLAVMWITNTGVLLVRSIHNLGFNFYGNFVHL